MSVHWEKDNSFVHCAGCNNHACKIRSSRITAGCANGTKEKIQTGRTKTLMKNEVSS